MKTGTRRTRPATLQPSLRSPGGLATPLACAAALLAAVLLAAPASADEVLLNNGDRLTGTVQKFDDSKLKFKTDYAKTLEIAWSSIQGLSTDAEVTVELADGSRIRGTLAYDPAQGLSVISRATGTVPIGEPSKIQSINIPLVTYTGNVEAGVTVNSGNSDTVSGNAKADFVARAKRQRFTLRGGWNYAEDSGTVSARNANGEIQYDFFPLDKLYVYVNTRLEYDRFQDLNLRAAAGGGLGYQVFDDSIKKLAFELGISYLNEDYQGLPDKSQPSGRWALNIDYKIVPDRVVFFLYHSGYFGLEDASDMNLRSDQGFRFTVVKDFFTSLQAVVKYNNAPAPGKDKTDTQVLFTLGYSFSL